MDADTAWWIAIGSATVTTLVVATTSWMAWRAWRRTSRTQAAAGALLDAHRARIDEALAVTATRTGALAEDSEQLAVSLGQLKADAEHLKWMLGRIPEGRDRLRQEFLDLVLPTGAAAGGDETDADDA